MKAFDYGIEEDFLLCHKYRKNINIFLVLLLVVKLYLFVVKLYLFVVVFDILKFFRFEWLIYVPPARYPIQDKI